MSDKRRVAVGLSTAVWPGAGQVYLGRYVLGVALGLTNLLAMIVLIWDLVVAVALAWSADGFGWSLFGAAWRMVPARAGWALGVMTCAWLAGIADASRELRV